MYAFDIVASLMHAIVLITTSFIMIAINTRVTVIIHTDDIYNNDGDDDDKGTNIDIARDAISSLESMQ